MEVEARYSTGVGWSDYDEEDERCCRCVCCEVKVGEVEVAGRDDVVG